MSSEKKTYSVKLSTTPNNINEKFQVVANILENVDDNTFVALQKKIQQNPKFFKDLMSNPFVKKFIF